MEEVLGKDNRHAKVSPAGLRYFAHDAGAPACSAVGEPMARYPLKLEPTVAVRAAGWVAELEVAGPDGSRRPDVLGCSLDGLRRLVGVERAGRR